MSKGKLRRVAASVFLLCLCLTAIPFSIAAGAELSLSGNFLPAVVAGSKPHREALTGLIHGKRGLPSWVRNMVSRDRYVALASKRVEVEDKPMQLFSACQPGNCPASAVRLLYSKDGKRAVMRISDMKLGTVVLGSPTPAEAAVLAAE
ncbi:MULTISPECIES: Ivy family c-type lysozyme inhibitor [Alphaproteobacteria]|uniref:Inhibitor of vertebrate lysozyme n=2 Tax=Alphaproteobacteria TaxID=28211 RepID=A0A512HFJ4_9HYPH|nr:MULTISPECIES: Ivy family c-type lysozyme inhibitor [Alphaproteobacteria]GEO84208.1 hypothetical protein RNA01_11400 [Ciceribacter naphthalenivorans]GLR24744.1 hypothetical protein GCM10007920_45380 [Ciceribacter naphthalenivorans]GLT07600.1 hypothetical protein GCM10007926_45380 [Sphingomonas psychrolutea]